MRIGLKLTAAFLVIASLVAATAYVAQRTGRELREQLQRLSKSAIRQMAITTEVLEGLYADQLAAHRQIVLRRRLGTGGSSSAEARARREQPDRRRETSEKELIEMVLPLASSSPEALKQKLAQHQQLMKRFGELVEKDAEAAERLLEDQICRNFESEILPRLAAIREQAEYESTRGIRSAERALLVADQRRGMLLAATAAVSVLIGLFMSRSIGKPLRALQQAAQDIGRGCLDTRVAIRSRDEIGMLAAAVNRMAAELEENTVSKRRLHASLREKELLLKEVHHRVKNNLQVISSLLSLQAQEIREPETIRLFQESQARVRSMALIHEQLYRSDDLAHIDFAAYVQELVDHLKQGFGSAAARVDFRLDLEPVPLLLDLAIPCGMIVNELVANALEHAFPEDRPGEIRIVFRREDGACRITVADNGVGMAEGPAVGATASIGLKVVEALTRQIHGTLDRACQEGTVFTICFANPQPQPETTEEP